MQAITGHYRVATVLLKEAHLLLSRLLLGLVLIFDLLHLFFKFF